MCRFYVAHTDSGPHKGLRGVVRTNLKAKYKERDGLDGSLRCERVAKSSALSSSGGFRRWGNDVPDPVMVVS